MEITLFCALFLLFLVNPSQMLYVFLLIAHVPRGILGLFIVLKKGLPVSHEIINKMEINDPKNLSLQKIQDNLGESAF